MGFNRPMVDFGRPRGLWSLWDMLKLNAAAFHRAATCLSEFSGLTRGAAKGTADPINVANREAFKKLAMELLVELETLQTRSAYTRTARFVDSLDDPKFTYEHFAEAVEDITSRVQDDLLYASVYVLDDSKIKFFESAGGQFGLVIASLAKRSVYRLLKLMLC